MNLYLVRHTKVDISAGICYGQTDVPLLSSFSEEACEIQTKLENIRFTHCFSSPLKRCRKLAETIVSGTLNIRYDNRLKELNFGKWEGKHWNSFHETEEAKKWFNDYLNVACPDGESYRQLLERVRLFLNDLSQLPDDSTVLIVSHGGPIRGILAQIESIDPKEIFEIPVDYGEIKKINLKQSKL